MYKEISVMTFRGLPGECLIISLSITPSVFLTLPFSSYCHCHITHYTAGVQDAL